MKSKLTWEKVKERGFKDSLKGKQVGLGVIILKNMEREKWKNFKGKLDGS